MQNCLRFPTKFHVDDLWIEGDYVLDYFESTHGSGNVYARLASSVQSVMRLECE